MPVSSLRSSLGVVLGANVGTTSTAWVSFDEADGHRTILHRPGNYRQRLAHAHPDARQGRLLLRIHTLRTRSGQRHPESPSANACLRGAGSPAQLPLMVLLLVGAPTALA